MPDYDIDWDCVESEDMELVPLDLIACLVVQYLKEEKKKSLPLIEPDVQISIKYQLRRLDDLLVHASVCTCTESGQPVCSYPNCLDAKKVLYRRLFFCKERECLLCETVRRLIKFHGGACQQSNCTVPGCSEVKEKKMRKERKLRKRQQRLERLQKLEPQRAAAAAALQLSLEASVKAMMRQSLNDVNEQAINCGLHSS